MSRLPALAAGAAWTAVWAQFVLAHGTTSDDQKRIVLGLTHYDSAKLLVVPLLLAALAVWRLRRRRGRLVALGGLAAMVVGVALGFWPLEWGVYPPEDGGPGPAASLLAAFGALVLAGGLVAQRGAALVAGLLVLPAFPWLHETLYGVLPAVGFAVLALAKGEERPNA